MVSKNLVDALEMIQQAIDTIRTYRQRNQLSVREFARLAGLSPATIVGIDDPDWSPTVNTLRRLAMAMNGPEAAVIAAGEPGLRSVTVAVTPYVEGRERCLERRLRIEAVKLLALHGYREILEAGRPDPCQVVTRAKELMPNSAVHLIDTTARRPEDFRFLIWDASTGYRGGADFTGTVLADVREPAYLAELIASYGSVRATGKPHLAFVHRRGLEGTRTFLRLLIPFIGNGSVAQIVSVALPQDPQTARYFLPNRLRI